MADDKIKKPNTKLKTQSPPPEFTHGHSHNPFWQSTLFNEVYLLNDVPTKYKEMWDSDELGPFAQFSKKFQDLCVKLQGYDLDSWSERNTINRFIKPILKMLGYVDKCSGDQEPWAEDEPFTVKEDGQPKTYKPDFIIVNDPKELKYIERKKGQEKIDEARASVVIPIEAKYWDRIDDLRKNSSEDPKRADKKDQSDATRALDFDEQCLKYMEILNKDYGILTDGKTWRLYHRELSADSYHRCFTFNLGHLVKHVNAGLDKDNDDYKQFWENAKYFFHIFSKTSVYSETGDRLFLDELIEYSKKYVTQVEEDLKDRFVKAMAYACNGYQRATKNTDLELFRNVAESNLFNILFIKHCEARNILPLKQSAEYRQISLSNIIDKLEHYRPEKQDDDLNLPMLRRMFSKDFNYQPDGTEIYDRLLKLTKIIQNGSNKEYKSFEIKAFTRTIFSASEWTFAQNNKLTNLEMVSILFELGYCKNGPKYQQIPYNFFSPRQIGSIYESFLGFRLEKATDNMAFIKKQWVPANLMSEKIRKLDVPKVRKGSLFFSPDNKDRKATGSYYTPDHVVQHIVKETLDPLVRDSSSEDIMKLRVCDPAMGSGHFLNAALTYLSKAYLIALERETNDDLTVTVQDAKDKILPKCIYGVDINHRAVKLAKMSLWLESAISGRQLEGLDDQLKCGNSLIDTKQIAGALAFNWNTEFDFMRGDKFSAVVGNPPYKIEYDENIRTHLREQYKSFSLPQNVFTCFIEKALTLISAKRESRLGFIIPNTFIGGQTYEAMREIMEKSPFSFWILDLGSKKIFDEAHVYTSILIGGKESIKSLNIARLPEEGDIENISLSDFELIKNSSKEGWKVQTGNEIYFSKLPALGTLAEVKDIGFNYWSQGRGKTRGGSIGDRVFYDGKKKNKNDIPYAKGRDIDKFTFTFGDRYLIHNWNNKLVEGDTFRFSEQYFLEKQRIVYRQTSSSIIATLLKAGIYNDKTVHVIKLRVESINQKLLLGYLNSSLMTKLYRHLINEDGQAFAQVKTVNVKQLPIVIPSTRKEKELAAEVEELVERALSGKYNAELQTKLDVSVESLYKSAVLTSKLDKP
jgi:hypothetical protein